MPENIQSHDVLCDILRVLERIEIKLDKHEEQIKQLSDSPASSKLEKEKEKVDETESTLNDGSVSMKLPYLAGLEKEISEETGLENVKNAQKLPYSEWAVDQYLRLVPPQLYDDGWGGDTQTRLNQFYHLSDLSPGMKKRLGCTWELPDDNRFPLKIFKSNILKTQLTGGGPGIETLGKLKQKIEREMAQLCDFDEALRKHPGNDFVVVDFDPYNNSRMYRIGQEAIGSELMIDPSAGPNAPWSRLILYQGATTGESIDTERKRPEQPIPYFSRTDRIVGVWDHLSYHLQLKNRSSTTNPYFSPWTGFHTTFYEIIESTELKEKELWKHGPLYDHPLGWQFRKCAFTLYGPASSEIYWGVNEDRKPYSDPARHWTLLVVAPNGFFNEHSILFPSRTTEVGFKVSQTTIDPLGKLTQAGAELKFIGQGLEKISERWADFQAYFDYMLDSGNALMHPSEHDNLLFDDGAFSRSRKYFWAIDCLAEFDASISDNLAQWNHYRVARIDPVISSIPNADRGLLRHVERQCRILENQRESFRQKLAAIKTLRDALFNASAVIESRASTRLGENVKLLTFVSIFFLPLSFTTSLWSINDKFSTTVLVYVIILVAVATYFTMFNINSLADGFGGIYNIKKKQIVRAMKTDSSEAWKQRGRRFEVFRPKHEKPEPSEWLIPLYVLLHPGVLFGFKRGRQRRSTGVGDNGNVQRKRRFGMSRLFRRERPVRANAARTDEGWVL